MIDVGSGESASFRGLGEPLLCANCSYIIVRNGLISDLEIKANRLTAIAISGGSVHQLDSSRREIPLSVPNLYLPERSKFEQLPKLRSLLTARDTMIRGIVVEGDVLRNIIVSETELSFDARGTPYVRLTSANMAGGTVRVESGGQVNVQGEGFFSVTSAQSNLRILLGDEVIEQDVAVDNEGRFRTDFKARHMPGDYEIVVEQKEGRRLTRERAKFKIIIQERPRIVGSLPN